jgi:hypothetical protein
LRADLDREPVVSDPGWLVVERFTGAGIDGSHDGGLGVSGDVQGAWTGVEKLESSIVCATAPRAMSRVTTPTPATVTCSRSSLTAVAREEKPWLPPRSADQTSLPSASLSAWTWLPTWT